MNLVAIIGNVASTPELRHTPSGRAVCTFRIAVSRPGGDTADFFTVVTWERQAEVVAEYCQVGRRVGIEGRMHHSTWQDKNGENRSKVEIVANRVQLLGSKTNTVKNEDEVQQEEPATVSVADSDSNIPF